MNYNNIILDALSKKFSEVSHPDYQFVSDSSEYEIGEYITDEILLVSEDNFEVIFEKVISGLNWYTSWESDEYECALTDTLENVAYKINLKITT